LGDQQAALVGRRLSSRRGQEHLWHRLLFLLMNTGERPVPSNYACLTTVAYKFGSGATHYELEGGVAIRGRWCNVPRQSWNLEKSADVEPLARTVKDNGRRILRSCIFWTVCAVLEGKCAWVVAGLTRYANSGPLCASGSGSHGISDAGVVDAMEKDSHIGLATLRVDGGMVANELLMPVFRRIFEPEVVRPWFKKRRRSAQPMPRAWR